MSVYKFLAWTSPGLQEVLIYELKIMGIYATPNKLLIYPSSAVVFEATMDRIHKVMDQQSSITFLNLQMTKQISARNPREFLNNIQKVQLHPFIPVDSPLEIKCSIKRSCFNHAKNWESVIKTVLEQNQSQRKRIAAQKLIGEAQLQEIVPEQVPVRINAYLYKDFLTMFVQLHRDSLHKHGLKKYVGKVNLAENIAASMIHLAQLNQRQGWTIWDPFCGCGSILISALVSKLGLRVQRDFSPFKSMPIYQEMRDETQSERLNFKLIGTDIDIRQIRAFQKNIQTLGINKQDSQDMNKTTYEDLEIAVSDFKRFKKPTGDVMIISNPPWNKELKFDDFQRMIRFIEQNSQESYLLISSEQFSQLDKTKWEILAEPLVGGTWTKIVHYVKNQIAVSKNQLPQELTYTKDISQYRNDKITALQQNITKFEEKLRNPDYIEHIKIVARAEAQFYGKKLSILRVGKNTKIKQLVAKRWDRLIASKLRNQRYQIQKMKDAIKEEQVELKKMEVKNKVIEDKFKLEQLSEEQKEKVQVLLDKAAKLKSVKILKDSKKPSIPKW